MSKQDISIIVIDDVELNKMEIITALKTAGYEDIRPTKDVHDVIKMHQKRQADIILADWLMPGMDGLELMEEIRRHDENKNHYTAIILFTAKDGMEPLVEAFERGVDDYLQKPIDNRELAARVYAASRIATQHNTLLKTRQLLAQENQRLNELALTDPLTGLGNRRYMHAHLEAMVKEITNRGGVATVCMADIDHFKTINDRYGHDVGDEVLTGFAKRLRWAVRPTDVVTRIGGEEFAVLMHHPDPSKYTPVIFERIRRAIAHHAIPTSVGDLTVTASMGIACYTNLDTSMTTETLLKLADERLYKAKKQGRNKVIC